MCQPELSVPKPLLSPQIPCVKRAPRGCGSAQSLAGHMVFRAFLNKWILKSNCHQATRDIKQLLSKELSLFMVTRAITTVNRGSQREKLEPTALEEEWMCWSSFLSLPASPYVPRSHKRGCLPQLWSRSLPNPQGPGLPGGPEVIEDQL